MSLRKTKPRWFPTAVATNLGWINPSNNEVLVSIRNLKTRIEQETDMGDIFSVNIDEILSEPKNVTLELTEDVDIVEEIPFKKPTPKRTKKAVAA